MESLRPFAGRVSLYEAFMTLHMTDWHFPSFVVVVLVVTVAIICRSSVTQTGSQGFWSLQALGMGGACYKRTVLSCCRSRVVANKLRLSLLLSLSPPLSPPPSLSQRCRLVVSQLRSVMWSVPVESVKMFLDLVICVQVVWQDRQTVFRSFMESTVEIVYEVHVTSWLRNTISDMTFAWLEELKLVRSFTLFGIFVATSFSCLGHTRPFLMTEWWVLFPSLCIL